MSSYAEVTHAFAPKIFIIIIVIIIKIQED